MDWPASPFVPLEILIVDDDPGIRRSLGTCLEIAGHQVTALPSIHEAALAITRRGFDLIFLDVCLGLQNGLDFIPRLRAENPWTSIVIITAFGSTEIALEAVRRGASDYLPKPFTPAQVRHLTQKVTERRQSERKIQVLQATMSAMDAQLDDHAVDPVMHSAIELARRVAKTQAHLLISGEMGSGKARLAQAIHAWSHRAGQPLATVICRSDHGDILEAELFGVKTGDKPGTCGKVEFCEHGTLVLESVNEMPLRLQPRVARLLKDREFERHDQTTRRKANVRIIATTSVDLQQAVDNGAFRADLLMSLNVVQIHLPPLRDRPAELQALAHRYLNFFSQINQRRILNFTPEALHALRLHRWPGNVRELRNVVERAVLLCQGESIGVEHLPPNLLGATANVKIGDLVTLAMVEEQHVRRVVESAASLRQAAAILGIDAGTVVRRMKRYASQSQRGV